MSVVLTLNDASLSIVDLHAAMQQGCRKREGWGADLRTDFVPYFSLIVIGSFHLHSR